MVVVKILRKSSHQADNEARCLEYLKTHMQHPYIIELFGTYDSVPTKHNQLLVLEACREDLLAYKKRTRHQDRPVPEAFLWRIRRQMTEALMFLHNGPQGTQGRWTPLIHVDIKPNNILISPDPRYPNAESRYYIKLADFGMASWYDVNERRWLGGTPGYRPPECIFPKPGQKSCATPAVDIFGLGATLHFLVHAYEPESMRTEHRDVHPKPIAIVPVDAPLPPYAGGWEQQYSTRLNTFMCMCLEYDQSKRATARQLLAFVSGSEARLPAQPTATAAKIIEREPTSTPARNYENREERLYREDTYSDGEHREQRHESREAEQSRRRHRDSRRMNEHQKQEESRGPEKRHPQPRRREERPVQGHSKASRAGVIELNLGILKLDLGPAPAPKAGKAQKQSSQKPKESSAFEKVLTRKRK